MSKKITQLGTLFSAQAADAFATGINTTLYDFIKIQVVTTNTPDGTLFFWGSGEATEPAWATPSQTNICDKKFVYNENTGSSIQGDTGIAAPGNIVREYKLNVDFINFFTVQLDSNSTGEWYVKVIGLNKQF